jgi:arylsulfatase A-like enzyme
MRIVYFDVDSLRPDHLGCYGYVRALSPAIDAVAARGVRFERCYASDAPCLPSRAALFTGQFGIRNGVTSHWGPAAQLRPGSDAERPFLMRQLQRAGWRTVCFSGFARRHQAWWFSAGFTDFFGNRLPGGPESADEVNALVLPWLREHGASDNWFLHVNYWDVHNPYEAPDAFVARAAAQPGPAFPDDATIRRHHRELYGPLTPRDWWFWSEGVPLWTSDNKRMPDEIRDRAAFLAYVDGYDGGVAYVDAAIGRVLEQLERLGVRDETAVIVSADHGEAIGEFGMYFDHGNASEGVHHLPLVVAWPGAPAGVCPALLYQLDLGPTLLELLGLPVPAAMDGESVAAALRGQPVPGRSHIVRGCGIYTFQRAVLRDGWLLVRTLHPGLYPIDPLYLFDLSTDPHGQRNLVEQHPETARELEGLLSDWWHRHCAGPGSARDPFQAVMESGPDHYCPPPLVVDRMRALGRTDQLRDLARRRPDLRHLIPEA